MFLIYYTIRGCFVNTTFLYGFRYYIWNEIIQCGFSPSGKKEQDTWLYWYQLGLQNFWRPYTFASDPVLMRGGQNKFLIDIHPEYKLEYEIRVQQRNKYKYSITVKCVNRKDSNNDLIFKHECDDSNYFRVYIQDFFPESEQYQAEILGMKKGEIENIVESVLNSLIFHPNPHQHITSPVDNHNVRIGGGIANPFLYLFSLRYQLCYDSDKQDSEKMRLCDLFVKNICSKRHETIPPHILLPNN